MKVVNITLKFCGKWAGFELKLNIAPLRLHTSIKCEKYFLFEAQRFYKEILSIDTEYYNLKW